MRKTFRVLGRNIHPQMVPMKTVQGRTSYTGVCRQMKPVTGVDPPETNNSGSHYHTRAEEATNKRGKGFKEGQAAAMKKGPL